MPKRVLIILVWAAFTLNSFMLYGVGEKILSLGGAAAWGAVESRQGIVEVASVRPYPVLALSSERNRAADGPVPSRQSPSIQAAPDLVLSFDEGQSGAFRDAAGRYAVAVSSGVSAMGPRWARLGSGAAYFIKSAPLLGGIQGNPAGTSPLVVTPFSREALLSQGRLRDFSVEFWICPMTMENGERVLSWSSARETPKGERITARIQCIASKNRLQWTFSDFFTAPGDEKRLSVSFSGLSPVTPRTWSHHLVRFDANTGLLEYLVNGAAESIRYATVSGREDREVYTPLTGPESVLALGDWYAGFIDEFRFYSGFVETPQLQKYPGQGGRMETRAIDLGEGQNRIIRIDAFGGRASIGGRSSASLRERAALNEYGGADRYRFADDSALQFFIRTSDSLYVWNDQDWRPFEPGKEFAEFYGGRYIQLAAVFYPSGDGETSPYLEELRIVYQAGEPPLPPPLVTAAARDGGVDLSWRASPGVDTAGYLVYYGTSRGEYFGIGALEGASPVDVGNRTFVRIGGLRNGVLYYFAVAAYNSANPTRAGEFSREVTARPLQGVE